MRTGEVKQTAERRKPAGAQDGLAGSERVYVTGLGPICVWGLGVEAFARGFWEGTTLLTERQRAARGTHEIALQRVPEFNLSDYIGSTHPYLDLQSRFGLAAASLALGSAGVEGQVPQPGRSGLATASVFGNVATQETFRRTVRQKDVRCTPPTCLSHGGANATNDLVCVEFGLRGYNQHLCGDSLCGSRSLETGWHAIRSGLADLMLVGGCDALSDRLLEVLSEEYLEPGAPPLSEGACLLVLENESSMEQRRGRPICELLCLVSRGTGLAGRPQTDEDSDRIAGAISSAISSALEWAGLWEGDIGLVVLPVAHNEGDRASSAAQQALSCFSQVPTVSASRLAGETFAAGFPLECAAAALLLNEGRAPLPPKLDRVQKAVEFWVGQEPQALLGEVALVLEWSNHCAVAALLKAV